MSNENASKPFTFDSGTGAPSGGESFHLGAPESGISGHAPDPATTASTQALGEIRRKRGRRSQAEIDAEVAKRQAEFAEEYKTLFEPRTWGMLCRAPADLMLTISKRQIWDIPEKEIEPLAIGASHTARLFLKTDPKWIALTIFGISLVQVYGTRFALHMAEMRKERAEALAKKRGETGAP